MKKSQVMFFVLLSLSLLKTLEAQVIAPSRSCPRVNIAKMSDTICGLDNGGEYSVAADILGSNLLIEWSSDGFGYFGGNEAGTIYHYDRSDAGRGSVWLYVVVTDTLSRCPKAMDSLFLKLNDPARISFQNADLPACGNSPVYIEADMSGTATEAYWHTSGTGYFGGNTFNNIVYYPSLQDRRNGVVEVTATTNDPAGPCPAANASVFLVFTDGIIDAGPDLKICSAGNGGIIELNPTVYGNQYNGTWTTNGTGIFDDPAYLYTNYNYTAKDVASGNIELYLTTNNYDCGIYIDTVKVWLQQPPVFTIPREFVSACGKRPVVAAEVQLTGLISGGNWTSTGSGVFANPTSLVTTYKASRQDLLTKCVQLIFKSNSEDPCGSVSSKPIKACFYEQCNGRREISSMTSERNTISLYPNPATAVLNIRNPTGSEITGLNITDITGKNIQVIQSGNKSLNIGALRPGMYFLHVATEKGNTIFKFIKL